MGSDQPRVELGCARSAGKSSRAAQAVPFIVAPIVPFLSVLATGPLNVFENGQRADAEAANENLSEALSRTMKYRPEYPEQAFGSISAARAWVERLIDWYNNEHIHSALKFFTPA